MARKNNPYFDDFIKMINFSYQAAEHLQASLQDYRADTLEEQRRAMHQIENQEDELKHSMMNRLMKEFVPPIDRADIINLSNGLDDITDKIEDILIRLYMYNIKKIRPAALVYAEIIVRSCKTLQQALAEFPNFRKSNSLMNMLIEINSIEEEGDRLYVEAVRELYEKGDDSIEISSWSKLFDLFEECCDACEHAADVMEIIIMKNS